MKLSALKQENNNDNLLNNLRMIMYRLVMQAERNGDSIQEPSTKCTNPYRAWYSEL